LIHFINSQSSYFCRSFGAAGKALAVPWRKIAYRQYYCVLVRSREPLRLRNRKIHCSHLCQTGNTNIVFNNHAMQAVQVKNVRIFSIQGRRE